MQRNKIGLLVVGILLVSLVIVNATALARRETRAPRGRWMNVSERGQAKGQLLPELLGMEIEEYINARKEGKSISDLASQQGKTMDELKEALTNQMKSRWDEQDRIREERRQHMMSTMDERLDVMLNSNEFGPRGEDYPDCVEQRQTARSRRPRGRW